MSPAHYKAWLEAPDEPTDAMIFGSLCHRLILEPELFESSCVVAPECDRRTKLGKELWDQFQTENAGKTVLKPSDYATLRGMVSAWKAHPLNEAVHTDSKHEHAAFWVDAETGLSCKARPDIVHSSGMVLDIKTTDSALASDFQRTISKFRYHVQAAWYLDGITEATGARFDQFLFIAIEKKPPYGIGVYVASKAMLDQGRQAYKKDFATYAQCVRENHWPSYPTEVQPIDLPIWALV